MNATDYITKQELNDVLDEKFDQFEEKIVKSISNAFDDFGRRIDERFDKVESRLDRIELEISDIKGRLSSIESRLDSLEHHLKAVDKRDIDDSNAFAGQIVELQKQLKLALKRITALEAQKIK